MKAILGVVFMMLSSTCFAVSGNDFLSACKSTQEFEQGFCGGFVQAVKYSVVEFPSFAPSCKEKLALIPLSQLKDVVIKEFSSNPEKRHYSAYSISFMAIAKGFGCLSKLE
jgi:hypothetical protein